MAASTGVATATVEIVLDDGPDVAENLQRVAAIVDQHAELNLLSSDEASRTVTAETVYDVTVDASENTFEATKRP